LAFPPINESWESLMSMMFLAAMMMAQAPAAVPPAPPAAPVAKKQKPAQICELIEITGSRSKRRVCRDASGNLDLGPGVSNSGYGKTRIDQSSPSAGPTPGGSQ
jgi:hypothetical protein